MNYLIRNNQFAGKKWVVTFPDSSEFVVFNLKAFAVRKRLDYQFLICGKTDKGFVARAATKTEILTLPVWGKDMPLPAKNRRSKSL